ncbi:MAG: hypothetical protein V4671_00230 [Armatimonadota bacterium]
MQQSQDGKPKYDNTLGFLFRSCVGSFLSAIVIVWLLWTWVTKQ